MVLKADTDRIRNSQMKPGLKNEADWYMMIKQQDKR